MQSCKAINSHNTVIYCSNNIRITVQNPITAQPCAIIQHTHHVPYYIIFCDIYVASIYTVNHCEWLNIAVLLNIT